MRVGTSAAWIVAFSAALLAAVISKLRQQKEAVAVEDSLVSSSEKLASGDGEESTVPESAYSELGHTGELSSPSALETAEEPFVVPTSAEDPKSRRMAKLKELSGKLRGVFKKVVAT